MGKSKGHTVRGSVTPRLVKKPGKIGGRNLSKEEVLAERHYRICLQIVYALHVNGLLTEKEAVRVRKRLQKQYSPVIGMLTDDSRWKEVRK